MLNNFYVYIYLNPFVEGNFEYNDLKFCFEPLYVGKGVGYRYRTHLYSKYLKKDTIKNKILKEILITKIEPIIIKLYENLSEDDSFKIERDIIKKIGCLIYNNGPLTNLTTGGDGRSCAIITDETRKKLSECGKRNGFLGKKLEEIVGVERAKELNEKNKLRKLNKSYVELSGEKRAEIIKKKMSNSQTGKKKITENGKKILSEFHKNKVVSKETKNKISKSLIGHKRNLGKFHTISTKLKISNAKKGSIPHNKYQIIQYDMKMNIIKEWESATEASLKLNISQGNITSVINNIRKSASGFIWKKKN